MGLTWVRLDVGLPRNTKILAMLAERDGHRAAFAYTCSILYCGEQGSDGFIPRYALPHIHARPKDALLLVTHRLWHPDRNDIGWLINDWAEFQPSSTEIQDRTRKARNAAIKANCIRWHGPDCHCWKDSET